MMGLVVHAPRSHKLKKAEIRSFWGGPEAAAAGAKSVGELCKTKSPNRTSNF